MRALVQARQVFNGSALHSQRMRHISLPRNTRWRVRKVLGNRNSGCGGKEDQRHFDRLASLTQSQ